MGLLKTDITELPFDQQEMLNDLCARNHPAEVDFVTDKGSRRFARTRFLARADDDILIDQPVEKSMPLLVRPGETVTVYYLVDDNRYAFMSTVVSRELFQLRAHQKIPALRLTCPIQIYKAQRRDNYRLSVLHLPSSNFVGEITVNDEAMEIEGSLVNVSAGGACLVLHDQAANRHMRVGGTLLIELNLPDTLSNYPMPAKIVWLQREASEKRLRVGIEWMLDDSQDEGCDIYERIARFVLIEQQRVLRKEAEKK